LQVRAGEVPQSPCRCAGCASSLRDDLPEVRRRMRAALESISLSPRRLGSRWQAAMTVYVLNREDAWFFLRRPLPGPPQTTSLCHAVDVDRLSLLQPR